MLVLPRLHLPDLADLSDAGWGSNPPREELDALASRIRAQLT